MLGEVALPEHAATDRERRMALSFRWLGGSALVLAVVAAMTGCASPDSANRNAPSTVGASVDPSAGIDSTSATSGSTEPPANPTINPTRTLPSGFPTVPTDPTPTDLLVGRVIDNTGPCYALENDDGITFALYSQAIYNLSVNATIWVRFKPLGPGMNCGAAHQVLVVEIGVV